MADLLRASPRALEGPLAGALARVLMATHEKEHALANLARVFPERSAEWRRDTARASYALTARALIEFLHTPRYSDDEIKDRVRLDGAQHLRASRDAGSGTLLLTGHYGNWEWLGRRVALEGDPFAVLFKEAKDAGLNARLRAAREAAGMRAFEHDDVRAALGWLRAGNVLGIVMDLEPVRETDGVVAPLFGVPTRTYVGPFRLARRTGAPVLTFFCRAEGPGRYRARIEPFALSTEADPERAALADATAFNARLEAAVLEAPDHWVWTYRRWKRIDRDAAAAARGAGPRAAGPSATP